MLDFNKMHKLVTSDVPYVYINEKTQEISFSIENDTWYDVNGEMHRVFFTENYLTVPLGDSLFSFLAIKPHDIEKIYTQIENQPKWWKYRDEHIQDETERFLASLDCAYLYILFYSDFREQLNNEYTQRLDRLQKEFEFALNFCCNDEFIPELATMSAQNKYYIYSQLYTDNRNTCDRLFFRASTLFTEPNKQYEVLNMLPRMGANNEKYVSTIYNSDPVTDKPYFPPEFSLSLNGLKAMPIYRYSYDNLSSYLMEELLALIKSDARIKKCKICGKYFIMKGNYSTDCCDRIPDGQKFTCKKIAAIQSRKEKLNSNPILKEYEKSYKRNYAKRKDHRISGEDFEKWSSVASQKRDSIIQEYGNNPPEDVLKEFKIFLGNR